MRRTEICPHHSPPRCRHLVRGQRGGRGACGCAGTCGRQMWPLRTARRAEPAPPAARPSRCASPSCTQSTPTLWGLELILYFCAVFQFVLRWNFDRFCFLRQINSILNQKVGPPWIVCGHALVQASADKQTQSGLLIARSVKLI
jgi:hypothetical protein